MLLFFKRIRSILTALMLIMAGFALVHAVGGSLPPFLVSLGYRDMASDVLVSYGDFCHQMPSRTFWMLGYPLGLCARCLGAYTGTVLMAMFLWKSQKRVTLSTVVTLGCLALVDKAVENCLLINLGNTWRFVAGLCLGAVLFAIIWMLRDAFDENRNKNR